jgi:hypothetical protein
MDNFPSLARDLDEREVETPSRRTPNILEPKTSCLSPAPERKKLLMSQTSSSPAQSLIRSSSHHPPPHLITSSHTHTQNTHPPVAAAMRRHAAVGGAAGRRVMRCISLGGIGCRRWSCHAMHQVQESAVMHACRWHDKLLAAMGASKAACSRRRCVCVDTQDGWPHLWRMPHNDRCIRSHQRLRVVQHRFQRS